MRVSGGHPDDDSADEYVELARPESRRSRSSVPRVSVTESDVSALASARPQPQPSTPSSDYMAMDFTAVAANKVLLDFPKCLFFFS